MYPPQFKNTSGIIALLAMFLLPNHCLNILNKWSIIYVKTIATSVDPIKKSKKV